MSSRGHDGEPEPQRALPPEPPSAGAHEPRVASAPPGRDRPGRAARLSARLRAGIVGAVAGVVLLVIFAVENVNPATVHFLAWSWPGTPVFAVILCSVVLGFLIGVLFMLLRPGRPRTRAPGTPPTPPPPAVSAAPPNRQA